MRMVLEGESQIRLEMVGDGFEITSADISISPYHLLAGSLASCIALVMVPWAERSGLDLEPLSISICWERASDEHEVKHMGVALRWPGLPDSRLAVVERLAKACPIHATLLSGTEITNQVRGA